MSTKSQQFYLRNCLSLGGFLLATVFVTCDGIRDEGTVPLPPVRFNSDGSFKITLFTDLHYGELPFLYLGPEQDMNSTRVMRDILRMENPDFVIFTGDQVSAELMYENVTAYIDMLLEPVVEKGYRWASVYGNHDTGELVSRSAILKAEQAYTKLCYTQQMKPELPGVTNYYIPIYGPEKNTTSKDEVEKPVMLWWFFDSQGGYKLLEWVPFYIDEKVVEWFRNENKQLQAKWGKLPSLVFFHIPPVEYTADQESINSNSLCSGLNDEKVTPQEKNTKIMDALLEAGEVQTIFVGHDHGNSWCCYHKDIEVCYNRHTGYGGYGDWTRGSRIIQLDIKNLKSQTNYVRLENGDITDRFPKPSFQTKSNDTYPESHSHYNKLLML